MKRALLICLSLFLALGGWSAAFAEDGFYVVPAMKGNYAPVPKTGQTENYGATFSDGDLRKGVAWPTPRFTNYNNGTVTDNLTGLIWTQNANIFGMKNWTDARYAAFSLRSGVTPGLTDGSVEGDWRLPNIRELQSLLDYGRSPALPFGHPFTGAPAAALFGPFWSSTTRDGDGNAAWIVQFGGLAGNGSVWAIPKTSVTYLWCVRGGK